MTEFFAVERAPATMTLEARCQSIAYGVEPDGTVLLMLFSLRGDATARAHMQMTRLETLSLINDLSALLEHRDPSGAATSKERAS